MERTLDVTLSFDGGEKTIHIYENQSGDCHCFRIDELDDETARDVGWEILSWFELMEDENA